MSEKKSPAGLATIAGLCLVSTLLSLKTIFYQEEGWSMIMPLLAGLAMFGTVLEFYRLKEEK